MAAGLQGVRKGGEMVRGGFDGHISKELQSNAALLVRCGFRRKKNIFFLFFYSSSNFTTTTTNTAATTKSGSRQCTRSGQNNDNKLTAS